MKPSWKTGKTGPRGRPHASRPVERERGGQDDSGSVKIFGIHAVEAVLRNPHRALKRLALTDNAERRIADVLNGARIKAERVAPRDLDRELGEDTVHQGALVETEPLPEPRLSDLCAASERGGPIVVLDQVTDPHNVGAILRSAAVFGAAGLVMTRRHSPPLSGALAKTASGALEHVPVALVGNLAQAMAELGDAGVQRIGLDGEAAGLLEEQSFTGSVAFVLGSEGKGLRRLTRQHCDRLCRIGAAGGLASLNVSNAAAVALYAAGLGRRALIRS